MAADKLLFQIQQASRDKDKGVPGADVRLFRLIQKLQRRGPAGLRQLPPAATLKEKSGE